ncbi:MAG: hypothetical protein MZV64_23700 [Ignavibacteriales bacterium]|nr:hypothetical protein [Ignavibacteriales bacterium]
MGSRNARRIGDGSRHVADGIDDIPHVGLRDFISPGDALIDGGDLQKQDAKQDDACASQ